MRNTVFLLAALLSACSGAAQQAQHSACLEAGRWTLAATRLERGADTAAVLDHLATGRVVLLGERHDSVDHHRWQLQTLAALHSRQPALQIGFEMFPRRLQPVLDRWVAGELAVTDFVRELEWEQIWNLPIELYLPLFQFARINRIPMLALNLDSGLSRRIAEQGWAALSAAEQASVGEAVAPLPAYREHLQQVHQLHGRMRAPVDADHSGGDDGVAASERRFEHFVEAQLAWDRAMAGVLAAAHDDGVPLVVGIMGSGHIRYGHGVPHQLRALGVEDLRLALPVEVDSACAELSPGVADALFALPLQSVAAPPPPRLGVSLERTAAGVRLREVSAGSLAEASGLQADDVIVEAAGQPLRGSLALIAVVRAAPPGTWLPLQVQRGEERLEVIVRFPAAQE